MKVRKIPGRGRFGQGRARSFCIGCDRLL